MRNAFLLHVFVDCLFPLRLNIWERDTNARLLILDRLHKDAFPFLLPILFQHVKEVPKFMMKKGNDPKKFWCLYRELADKGLYDIKEVSDQFLTGIF